MRRTFVRTALLALVPLLALSSMAGCSEPQESTDRDTGMAMHDTEGTDDSADTRTDTDSSPGPLTAVKLDKLEMPEAATEGPLCVTLSSDTSTTLDTVSVRVSSTGASVHQFSDVSVTPEGNKNCTTACFCLGPEPPEINIRLQKGDYRHTIASGQKAPAGCCESM